MAGEAAYLEKAVDRQSLEVAGADLKKGTGEIELRATRAPRT